MKNTLVAALLTLTIAAMGEKALCCGTYRDESGSVHTNCAAVMVGVPDVIVGDRATDPSSNVFVFPDAFTIRASFPSVASSSIIWTFTTDNPSSPRYYLNGHPPVDLSSSDPSNDPNNADSTKRIDKVMANGEVDEDSDPVSVTIRDVKLSPFPAQTSYPVPDGEVGIIGSEVITLIASDGTTYGMRDFIAYTDDEGTNRFSGAPVPIRTRDVDFLTTDGGFTSSEWSGGHAVKWSWEPMGEGLCIQSPAGTSDNLDYYHGSWASPYGWFDLTPNAVYKIRMEVSSNSTQVLTVPLWTMFIENYAAEGETAHGQNAYSMQVYNLDNEGGANAAANYGRDTFYCYFAPSAVQTPQWNDAENGAFTAQYDAENDPRLHFRVLDAGTNLMCQNRFGTLCLSSLTVDRYDISGITPLGTVYEQTSFSAANGYVNPAADSTKVTYDSSSGYVTLAPKETSWNLEVATLAPGDSDGIHLDTPNFADNWPIRWEDGKLWMYEASISAPAEADAANPPDILALRIDTPTYEIFADNQMQALTFLGQQAMPKTAAATYTMFFYTQTKTASTIANYDAFRPMVEVTCHPNLVQQTATPGLFRQTNTGAIRVHSMKVTEVTF